MTVLLCTAAFAQTACVDQEKAAAEATANLRMTPSAPEVSLLTGLREELMDLAGVKVGEENEAAAINFYNVVDTVYDVRCRKVANEAAVIGDLTERIVAVNSKGDTYILDGAVDGAANFNRLINANLSIHITNSEKAVRLFYIYMDTVHHHDRSSLVHDATQLEIAALIDLRSRHGPKEGKRIFDSWWSKFPAQVKQMITEPTAKPMKDGFEVTYFYYFPLRVARIKLIVHKDGTITPVIPSPPKEK